MNKEDTLIEQTTDDGSLTLKSTYYNERFHSSSGAKRESKEKFLYPAEISRFKKKEAIKILDVCLGLGYNSAFILEEINKTATKLNWWGLEIDKRPLRIALTSNNFRKNWSKKILRTLELINSDGGWEENSSKGKILWGDARNTIHTIPKSLKFDLILHDGFSPPKCPEIWSEEFLNALANKLTINGRLITYSSSAAIRASLKKTGLDLKSLLPINRTKDNWSSGTLATKSSKYGLKLQDNERWQKLTLMEEEHLLTRAAIPYRDPNGDATSADIHIRRKVEQENSSMPSTSSWRKKWSTL